MRYLFVIMAVYFAWRAFKYTHLIRRTNKQNKEWLDIVYPEYENDNERIADVHRRSMLFDYIVGAVVCALIAYLL